MYVQIYSIYTSAGQRQVTSYTMYMLFTHKLYKIHHKYFTVWFQRDLVNILVLELSGSWRGQKKIKRISETFSPRRLQYTKRLKPPKYIIGCDHFSELTQTFCILVKSIMSQKTGLPCISSTQTLLNAAQ